MTGSREAFVQTPSEPKNPALRAEFRAFCSSEAQVAYLWFFGSLRARLEREYGVVALQLLLQVFQIAAVAGGTSRPERLAWPSSRVSNRRYPLLRTGHSRCCWQRRPWLPCGIERCRYGLADCRPRLRVPISSCSWHRARPRSGRSAHVCAARSCLAWFSVITAMVVGVRTAVGFEENQA